MLCSLSDIQIGRPEKIIEQDAPDVALRLLGCFWNIEAARFIEEAYSEALCIRSVRVSVCRNFYL